MPEIFNFHAVTQSIGSSGQPTREQFQLIADDGYDVVINLAMPDHPKSISDEGALVAALGMVYLHLPVPFDAPDERLYQLFCRSMTAFADRRVWVHCIVNARVSAFLYRYLQTVGFTPEESTTPVLDAWRPQMDEVWASFLARDEVRGG